jgi:hypothetical protein
MTEMAKTLVLVGAMFIVVGAGMYALGRIPCIGKLPGDIFIKKENFALYFPLTTCLLASAIVSLILFLWQRK